ncbi:type II toxin-antitoxin system VapC family toxin [Candidatus Bathyarchaeota archaeon]|nr:type II toxin-antitoxin system VapC family toxin [Candidatus Bathyarchaeota archaeon]
MVCLDTSFIIALIRRDSAAEKKLEECLAKEARLSTTPITACELFKGAYKTGKNENIAKVRETLSFLELLDFSVEACERYGGLVNELHLRGSPIGDLDTMVASIALTHGEPLLTSDKEHFGKVQGLITESW